ncbi:hypothetical protein H7B90_00770 [Cohnella xylanilytica]|uniref:Uncharacterized protein n=1 Tax=Cohnella xylanilytica TaxID=557555 RepID=A0A841TWD4_9BACL|nr:hypothetical protein [Cohnella xylanilytica]MBB6689924.1 hypothetical protein [Cohnella xylanilytica]
MAEVNKEESGNEYALLGELIDQKQQYRKIIKAAVAKWVKDFQDGRVQVNTVDDLKTLLEIDMELQKSVRFDQTLRDRKRGSEE